jgi:glycosyltransferase involved in cell wall biosynthesis
MTFAEPIPPRCDAPQKNPLIIWNHRWSFDKNAPSLFYALDRIVDLGIDFQIAFLGENSGRIPETFQSARKRLGHRIVQFGYEPNRDDYLQWLMKGDVIVSTSIQENFGMSVVEAARYGCIPLLPNRLSYPEIIPTDFHSDLLYGNQKEFIEKLSRILRNTSGYQLLRSRIALHIADFSWPHVIGDYDRVIESL